MFLQCPLNKKKKIYVTLFDYVEDDEYDGDLNEEDDEEPRIQFSFKLTNDAAPASEKRIKESHSHMKTSQDSYGIQNSSTVKSSSSTSKHNFSTSPAKSYTSKSSVKKSYVSSGGRQSKKEKVDK